MIEVFETPLPTSVDPALADMFATAAKYDAVCVLKTTLDQYAVYIAIFGIILGIAMTLAFQYIRRKLKERIEAAEEAEKAKEILENLADPGKRS